MRLTLAAALHRIYDYAHNHFDDAGNRLPVLRICLPLFHQSGGYVHNDYSVTASPVIAPMVIMPAGVRCNRVAAATLTPGDC